MALNLFKIFTGTTANDETGTPARSAGEGINNNMDLINNELTRIDSVSEKSANKATTLDNPNNTNYPTTQAVEDRVASIETNSNAYTDSQLTLYQSKSEKGSANGYAGLDANGKVPVANTYAAVDEIVEGTYIDATTFNDTSGNPVTPGTAKIYQDTSTGNPNSGKQFRWSGTQYSVIIASPGTTDEVVEGINNLYHTAERVRSTLLTGINTVVGGIISGADTVLSALGKLQGQITANKTALGTKLEKGTYTGTASDLAALAGSGISESEAEAIADLKVEDQIIDGVTTKAPSQNVVFDALKDKANTRLSNIEEDLSEVEKNDIKSKLGIVEGGGTGSGVTKRYLTWEALLADQANHVDLGIYYAADASGHSKVETAGTYAYFEYKGVANGLESDYRKLSEEESMDIAASEVTQAEFDGLESRVTTLENASLPLEHQIAGKRITNAAVTGTYNIDYQAGSLWVLTLTGATTLADINFPTGTDTKTIELVINGNFALTLPNYWEPRPSNDAYSGTVRNHFIVSFHNGTAGSEKVIYSLENLAT